MTSLADVPGATQGRTLPSTVLAPVDAPSPAPLVVISTGFQLARTQYTSLATHLASWGFVVILTDYADQSLFADHGLLAMDVPAVIDWALAQTSLSLDASRIAVAGHSLGGDISVYAAALDARIKAVVGWDPVDGNPSVVPSKMAGLTAAIAVVGETTDETGSMPCAPAGSNFQAFYAASPSPAIQIEVVDAGHMSWVDDPSCVVCSLCPAGTASSDSVHAITRRLDVAWLRRQLLSDAAMTPWLDNPPEVATGAVMISSK